MNRDILMANSIAELVAQKGGRVYYVGGRVRDEILGRALTDIDIEVHGLAPAALEDILDTCGQRMEIGKSFGIYALKGYALDIALPRTERATGSGHRDFDIRVCPNIGTKEAARRRDFTVNALMKDVLSGEIIDHFDGINDLNKRILRHVDDRSFPEDPLRVLRAAQFAARFEFDIAPPTMALCREISIKDISKERILEEMKKALLGAKRPSVFFTTLRSMGQLEYWFKELADLIGVEQNPRYHAEGDVWNHTMLVLDEAAKLRDQAREPLYFMLSALCHDLGKATATESIDGKICSYGHERAGLIPLRSFLSRLTGEQKLKKYVANMMELHMQPHALAAQNSSLKATNKLFDRALVPEDLILLAKADNLGRQPRPEQDYDTFISRRLRQYNQLMQLPQVTGRDLIQAGLMPDQNFKKWLDYAHKLHLSGVDQSTALKQTLAYAKEKPHK